MLFTPNALSGAMNLERANVWLYRVQQRLAITRNEAAALVALAALLLAGMVVQRVRSRPQAAPGAERAATDHRFQQGAARLRAAQKKAEQRAPAQEAERETSSLTASSKAKLDLNAASESQLERLPGVGPVLAGRIAAYRRAHGPFAEGDHLERVSGIGPKTMAQLAPLVSVSAAEAEDAPKDAKAERAP